LRKDTIPVPAPRRHPVRVLLVEGMNLLRGALTAALSAERDLHVAGAAATVDEAVAAAQALVPDVAVVDIDLLAGEGTAVAQRLAEASPECGTLVLADPGDARALRVACGAQVRGVVGKDTPPVRLADSIRRVADGERVVDPALVTIAHRARPNPLTPRQRDILRVMAQGLPSAEIAAQLRLTKGTVDNYISTIIRKTGSRNRLEAVRHAEESGWLSAPSR
jgi:two-component system, NarL family, response regulator DesR